MEIGSAYALQVCLLQIPAMVAFSAWYAPEKMGAVADTFTYVPKHRPGWLDTERYVPQVDLPALGCHRDHSLGLLADLLLH